MAALPAMILSTGTRAQTAAPAQKIDVFEAYRKTMGSADGRPVCWWLSGTLFAHVDGLREFAVVQTQAVTIVQTTATEDGTTNLITHQIGYWRDMITGEVARSWFNPFSSQSVSLSNGFREGPLHYKLSRRNETAATLALSTDQARVIAVALTASAAEGTVTITQSETKVQGFAQRDGRLPAVAAPGATGVQTVISLVVGQDELTSPRSSSVGRSGFFSVVYDSLPPWMGFGDRYGSGLIKGVMRKARPEDKVDPESWRRLRSLHPDAFKGDALKTDWA